MGIQRDRNTALPKRGMFVMMSKLGEPGGNAGLPRQTPRTAAGPPTKYCGEIKLIATMAVMFKASPVRDTAPKTADRDIDPAAVVILIDPAATVTP